MGYIPSRNQEGGEAVTMVSAFNFNREAGANVFVDKITIETAFASGKATKSVGSNPESVKAIFDRPGVSHLSTGPRA